MQIQPFPYQQEGVLQIERFGGRALLADSMGLGKTIQALLWHKWYGDTSPMVVVCPANLKYNWADECAKVGFTSEILSGMKAPRGFALRTIKDVYIVNYDVLGNGGMNSWARALAGLKKQPTTLALDECHFAKTRSARRTKWVKQFAKSFPHVIAISGTPLTNRPAELWPILNIVKPTLFPNFREYGERYCAPTQGHWGREYKGATRLPELHRILKQHVMIRRLKEDVLDQLPPKIRTVVPIQLDSDSPYKQALKESVKTFRRFKGGNSNDRAAALGKLTELKRLAGESKLKHLTKWLDELIDEVGKVIVFAHHKTVVGALRDHFGKSCVVVDGSTPLANRHQNIKRFNADPSCSVFVGNIQAAGTGWSCTSSDTVVFAEMGWTPGEHAQAEDRVYGVKRGTGTTHPSIFYAVAQDTVEAKLAEIIQKKQKILDQTLDGDAPADGIDIHSQLIAMLGET